MRNGHLIWIWLVLCLFATQPAQGLPSAGEPLTPFSARRLGDLQPVASQQLLEGSAATLLSFFTTWCKPCEKEIPELLNLVKRFEAKGFRVVLVSLDQSEVEEIREFVAKVGAGGLPVVWDEDGELMYLYEVFSLPTNILVDRQGQVAMAWQGYLPEKLKELEGRLEKLEAPR